MCVYLYIVLIKFLLISKVLTTMRNYFQSSDVHKYLIAPYDKLTSSVRKKKHLPKKTKKNKKKKPHKKQKNLQKNKTNINDVDFSKIIVCLHFFLLRLSIYLFIFVAIFHVFLSFLFALLNGIISSRPSGRWCSERERDRETETETEKETGGVKERRERERERGNGREEKRENERGRE